jgi:hypothetical protein
MSAGSKSPRGISKCEMVILSKALRLQAQLRQLRYEADIYLSNTPELPLLSPPVTLPLMMSGVASRAMTLDAEKIRAAPRCFGDLPNPGSIPLRLEHREDTNVGTIETLSYDEFGSLLITCRVTDARAAIRPAFSVASSIDDYEIDAATCSGTVLRARLQEISLVRAPMCSGSLVQRRYAQPPHLEFFDLAVAKVATLAKLVKLMEGVHA